MLVSYNWLKTLIKFDLSVEEISDLLTNTGLEVEKVHKTESVKGGLKGLVIGEVLTCQKHPDADRLSITTVNLGGIEPVQIVCGAPNVAAGQKVVVAPVGCTIHPASGDSFEIKKAKIRGQVSEGMICAEDEIGLGQSHDGILVLPENAQVGMLAAEHFNLTHDYQIEIGLTPNRGDAASHIGVARDIKAVIGNAVEYPKVQAIEFNGDGGFKITLPNPEMCPRYTGILLQNITVQESPDWLKKRLQSIDLKPINNVVDVTNFVLHELGQPIHAFDADKVSGKEIIVRPSTHGEIFTTLDGVERKMTGNELMISDPEKALAIAGVFGGLSSGVTNSTTSVFIESAYFNPATVRKSAKSQGLSTDASFRYERGCDPEITVYALQRVVDLLKEVAGATVASSINDMYPTPVHPIEINLDLTWLNNFCGAQIPSDKSIQILERLDFKVIDNKNNILKVEAPLYRSDVTRNVDVAEEVLRIYGYNQVEIPKRLSFTPAVSTGKTMLELHNKISQFLNGQGFLEIMNNSQNRKEDADENAVNILNPLSAELAVMRTSMLPGALSALAHNINRKNKNLLFYEFGKTYIQKENQYIETPRLMLVSTGSFTQKNWITEAKKADYFFLSGVVDSLYQHLGIAASAIRKTAQVDSINPKILRNHDVKQEAWSADINLESLLKHYQNVSFNLKEIPVFPVVDRDLSVVLDNEVAFKDVQLIVRESCGKYFMGLEVFDVYQGDRLPEGKKSYAISIQLYDSEQTMTDKLTDSVMGKVIKNLESKVGALIRK